MSVLMHCQKYSMLLISRYCFCLAYCADWKNWQQVPHSGPCHTSSRQGLYLAASCLYRKLAFIDIAILGPLFSVFPFLLWNSLWLVEVLSLHYFFLIMRMGISDSLWETFFKLCMVRNDLKKEDIHLLWLRGKAPIVAASQMGVQIPTGSLSPHALWGQ